MAYLKPAMNRPNLDVKMHALTTRVIMDGKKAVGVEYRRGGNTYRVKARKEVILSASAFNSPKLLMLSGIGPAEHLKEKPIQAFASGPSQPLRVIFWVHSCCTQTSR